MTSFADFARAHGLLIRDLVADGRVHRVPTADHPRKRNGAYFFDGSFGWLMDGATHDRPIIYRDGAPATAADRGAARAAAERQRLELEKEHAEAAQEAARIVQACSFGPHPYLARKGFPTEPGLIDGENRLVIPMRPANDYRRISSVQRIAEDGTKRFLPGGATAGCVFELGPRSAAQTWLVEGYATGLSVREALRSLYRDDRVTVCFSAGNLARVASLYGPRAVVVADADASGTGEAAARSTGLRWAMPLKVGQDANDLHMAAGIRAVAEMLKGALA
jgi:putative DNA primase/helicase